MENEKWGKDGKIKGGNGVRWGTMVEKGVEKGWGVGNVDICGFEVGGVGVLHLKYQWKKLLILINTPIV